MGLKYKKIHKSVSPSPQSHTLLSKIIVLEKTVTKQREILLSLNKQSIIYKTRVTTLENELSSCQTVVKEKKQELCDKCDKIERLQTVTKEYQKNNEVLSKEVKDRKEIMDNMKIQMEKDGSKLGLYQTRVGKYKEKLGLYDKLASEYNAKMENMKQELLEKNNTIEQLQNFLRKVKDTGKNNNTTIIPLKEKKKIQLYVENNKKHDIPNNVNVKKDSMKHVSPLRNSISKDAKEKAVKSPPKRIKREDSIMNMNTKNISEKNSPRKNVDIVKLNYIRSPPRRIKKEDPNANVPPKKVVTIEKSFIINTKPNMNIYSFISLSSFFQGPQKFLSAIHFEQKLYFTPSWSDSIGILSLPNHEINTVSLLKHLTGPFKFSGSILVGRTIYYIPLNSNVIVMFLLDNNQIITIDIPKKVSSSNKFMGGIYIDPYIYFTPFTSNYILIFNTLTHCYTTMNISKYINVDYKFNGAHYIYPNIYYTPCHSNQLGILNVYTRKFEIVHVGSSNVKYLRTNGCFGMGSKLYFISCSSDAIGVYHLNSKKYQLIYLEEYYKSGNLIMNTVSVRDKNIYFAPYLENYITVLDTQKDELSRLGCMKGKEILNYYGSIIEREKLYLVPFNGDTIGIVDFNKIHEDRSET